MRVSVLYDGHCGLCRQSVRVLRRLDWQQRLVMVDVQDRQALETAYPQLEHEALMSAIHVVKPNGRVLTGFFGLRYLAHLLPLLWPTLAFLYGPGADWYGPKLYGWVARRRYAINRYFGASCETGVCKLP